MTKACWLQRQKPARKFSRLETVLGLVKANLPDELVDTAYALSCKVAAVDGVLSQEELRLLEMVRDTLNIDRLTAAAIERGVAALNRRWSQS